MKAIVDCNNFYCFCERLFLPHPGIRLLKELKGEPAKDIEQQLTEKKMIVTTRMFGHNVKNINEEAVATYTTRAAEKLRRQKSAANVISVFVVAKEL